MGHSALLSALPVLAILTAAGLASGEAGASDPNEDEALRTRILAQLAEMQEPTAGEIQVAVRNGRVLLQGRVRLLEHSLHAERLAWKTPGVDDVENELRVIPLASAADEAIEQRIRGLIKGEDRFLDTNLELRVSAGLVTLRGMFRDPADVLELKHRIASISGVVAVEIDAVLLAASDPQRLDHNREDVAELEGYWSLQTDLEIAMLSPWRVPPAASP